MWIDEIEKWERKHWKSFSIFVLLLLFLIICTATILTVTVKTMIYIISIKDEKLWRLFAVVLLIFLLSIVLMSIWTRLVKMWYDSRKLLQNMKIEALKIRDQYFEFKIYYENKHEKLKDELQEHKQHVSDQMRKANKLLQEVIIQIDFLNKELRKLMSDYYPDLLALASGIIGGITTGLKEGIISGVCIIIPGFAIFLIGIKKYDKRKQSKIQIFKMGFWLAVFLSIYWLFVVSRGPENWTESTFAMISFGFLVMIIGWYYFRRASKRNWGLYNKHFQEFQSQHHKTVYKEDKIYQ